MTNLWGGRFRGKLDQNAFDLNTSLPFDQRLAMQDVKGSVAWATALVQAGVLTKEETLRLIACLSGTHQLIAKLIYGSGIRLMECLRVIFRAILGHVFSPIEGQ